MMRRTRGRRGGSGCKTTCVDLLTSLGPVQVEVARFALIAESSRARARCRARSALVSPPRRPPLPLPFGIISSGRVASGLALSKAQFLTSLKQCSRGHSVRIEHDSICLVYSSFCRLQTGESGRANRAKILKNPSRTR
jgi:hypothetical protein